MIHFRFGIQLLLPYMSTPIVPMRVFSCFPLCRLQTIQTASSWVTSAPEPCESDESRSHWLVCPSFSGTIRLPRWTQLAFSTNAFSTNEFSSICLLILKTKQLSRPFQLPQKDLRIFFSKKQTQGNSDVGKTSPGTAAAEGHVGIQRASVPRHPSALT